MGLILKLAWREIVHNRRFSLFFLFNLALGLTGFVTLDSFKTALQTSIDTRAKVLLGGDLSVSARRELTPSEIKVIDEVLGKDRRESRVTEFYSMVAFGKQTRLVQVKAVDENYPFYGQIKLSKQGAVHPSATQSIQKLPLAWVYPELLSDSGLTLTGNFKLGDRTFFVNDVVEDDNAAVAEVFRLAPRIYIGGPQLSSTNLMQRGSTANFIRLYHLSSDVDLDALALTLDHKIPDPAVRVNSPRSATLQIARSAKYLGDYLGLAALVAFFLSGSGAAYLFRNYLTRRLRDVAILMSLGLKRPFSQSIYFFQLIILGALSAVPATLFSFFLLPLLTRLLRIFLPFPIEPVVAPQSLMFGAVLGTTGSLLLCLSTIQGIRRLAVGELFHEGVVPRLVFNLGSLLSLLPALAFFWGLAIWLAKSWIVGSLFIGSLIGATLILIGAGAGLLAVARRTADRFSFALKMALRNLARNRLASISSFLAISLGTVMTGLVIQSQTNLKTEISRGSLAQAPTFFIFDIQEDQVNPLQQFITQFGKKNEVTLKNLSPSIRARIVTVNGDAFEKETDSRPAGTREKEEERGYKNRGVNLTYRDSLLPSEKIIEGKYSPGTSDHALLPTISLEKEFARHLNLKVGDLISFDVQGVPVATRVGSIRKVQWASFEPNFMIEFPDGVLDDAPKTFLASLVTESANKNNLQNELVAKFPNISLLEVSRLISKITDVIGQMALALTFMAVLALFSGLVVLFSITNHEAYLRRYDISLLKVLGADTAEILKLTRWEFGLLGFSAAFFGTAVSYAVSFAFAYFVFDQVWSFSIYLPLAMLILISFTCLLVTEFATRRIISRRPRALLQLGK